MDKYNFTIQHLSGVKHQNHDAMSRMRLAKCGWTECPDCKGSFAPFAEDKSVLTRHDEELIIKPTPAPMKVVVEAGAKAHSKILSLRTENGEYARSSPKPKNSRSTIYTCTCGNDEHAH